MQSNNSACGEGSRDGHRMVLEGNKRWGPSGQCTQGHGSGHEAAGPGRGSRRSHQIVQAPLL